jgi:ABC-type nickel/cobalt efflux system permease component RcnA
MRRRLGLAGIGLAGGLVPSPSALVVLLGAIGLGRAGLGVALVVAYGLGMAATLTAVGLLLVVARNRLSRLVTAGGWAGRRSGSLSRLRGRVAAGAPTATAALVVIVGLGIGLRAVA